MDIEGGQTEEMNRPSGVRVAGYLLVIPAAFGWVVPLLALRVHPPLAIACLIAVSLTAYGMFAVNLNWRGAQWTAITGSALFALLTVGLIMVTKPWALIFWIFCAPAVVLLAGPRSSREWFAAQAGTDSSR